MRTKLLQCFLATLLSLSFVSGQLRAQQALDRRIDSLKQLLAAATTDTGRISRRLALMPPLLLKCDLNGNTPEDSLAFFQNTASCRQLAQKLGNGRGIGGSFLWEANYYFNRGNRDKRNELMPQAFAAFRAAKDTQGLGTAYYFKAEMGAETDDKQARLLLYDSALIYLRKAGDRQREMRCLKGIPVLFLQPPFRYLYRRSS